jgi:hypothetical protein
VAKLYDLKPELVIDNGFLEQLQEMISDSNPMVRCHLLPRCVLLKAWVGCCQYDRSFDRYTYCCYIATIDIIF